jgi:hypothetical protein
LLSPRLISLLLRNGKEAPKLLDSSLPDDNDDDWRSTAWRPLLVELLTPFSLFVHIGGGGALLARLEGLAPPKIVVVVSVEDDEEEEEEELP